MRFIQFLFPRGAPKEAFIDMPDAIERLALELSDAGWSFEIEIFPTTGLVSMDVCDDEEPLAQEACVNGPEVPPTVEALVKTAHKRWEASGRKAPKGNRMASLEARLEREWGSQL